MVGKYKVTSQYIGDEKMFAVYRSKDTDAVDHSGNRELATGYMSNKEEANRVAELLNIGLEVYDEI